MHRPGNQRLVRLRFERSMTRAFSPDAIYRIAATLVAADRAAPGLEPFAVPGLTADLETAKPVDWSPREVERVVYQGPGVVIGAVRQVECRRLGQGWEVAIPGVCRLGVALDGSEVAVLDVQPDLTSAALAEAVVGPGLILALAVHGVFCLHASAVQTPDGAIVFVGDSGCGKSTLTRFLATGPVPSWTRVADDIVPIEPMSGGIGVLPHFPQLKLPGGDQYPAASAERLPVRMICVLAPHEATTSERVELRPVDARTGTLALFENTAAVRLFDRRLAADLLRSCARSALSVPLLELRYPLSLGSLPRVGEALARASASCDDVAGSLSPGRENHAGS